MAWTCYAITIKERFLWDVYHVLLEDAVRVQVDPLRRDVEVKGIAGLADATK